MDKWRFMMTRDRDEFEDQAGIAAPKANEARGNTRREFAKTLAALAALPLMGAGKALGNTERPPYATAVNPSTMAPAIPQAQAPEKPLPEAEALADVARILYGKNLNDDQMAEVKRSLSGRFRAAEAMKKIKLANGDEPAFIFSANPQ